MCNRPDRHSAVLRRRVVRPMSNIFWALDRCHVGRVTKLESSLSAAPRRNTCHRGLLSVQAALGSKAAFPGVSKAFRTCAMAQTGRTRIQLCGRLVVQLEGERLEDSLPGVKGRLLFAYLVLNRARRLSRDQLLIAVY